MSNDDNNNVDHPSHYNQAGIECIEAIKATLGDNYQDYCKGNVLKYLWRYKYKNGVEDLKKARWYLDSMIESLSVEQGQYEDPSDSPDKRDCCKNPSNRTGQTYFTDIGDIDGDCSCGVTMSECKVCGAIHVDQVEFFSKSSTH